MTETFHQCVEKNEAPGRSVVNRLDKAVLIARLSRKRPNKILAAVVIAEQKAGGHAQFLQHLAK
ncbi:MAG: hypothetical protein E5V21_28425 [Mesorhizobium sp.]|nr:MAG: hypothetical protein E5W00_25185 [Mesorhizobium sp.]TIX68725.1 MAG: hypothetical protein E5V21_28425 [Mesorhizobium sp.]